MEPVQSRSPSSTPFGNKEHLFDVLVANWKHSRNLKAVTLSATLAHHPYPCRLVALPLISQHEDILVDEMLWQQIVKRRTHMQGTVPQSWEKGRMNCELNSQDFRSTLRARCRSLGCWSDDFLVAVLTTTSKMSSPPSVSEPWPLDTFGTASACCPDTCGLPLSTDTQTHHLTLQQTTSHCQTTLHRRRVSTACWAYMSFVWSMCYAMMIID